MFKLYASYQLSKIAFAVVLFVVGLLIIFAVLLVWSLKERIGEWRERRQDETENTRHDT